MTRRRRLLRALGVGGKFLAVGALSTLIEIAVFNLLLWWGWDPVAAKIVASLVALVNAYLGNREWAFRDRDRSARMRQGILFLVANAVCTALGAGIVWAGIAAAGVLLAREPGTLAINVVNVVVFRPAKTADAELLSSPNARA
jgi:putative flippase GtrA